MINCNAILALSVVFKLSVDGFRWIPNVSRIHRLLHALESRTSSEPSILQKALQVIDQQHNKSSHQCNFEAELEHDNTECICKYEWLVNEASQKVAFETQEPVMSRECIELLRHAANEYWRAHNSTSRFTLQSPSNSEAHLEDVCELYPHLRDLVNNLLTQTLYPVVRHAFSNLEGPLCVYDAIIVRYNASMGSAFQPLHRDIGVVTINIALNDPNEFQGGGTFFESLATNLPIRLPKGTGYAIGHSSEERHAGAPTKHGIREILVIFLTTRPRHKNQRAPAQEQRARLKGMLQSWSDVANRIECLREAYHQMAFDGEMHLYLAHDLIQVGLMDEAMSHLFQARQLSPFDARAQFHLAQCLSKKGISPGESLEKTILLESAYVNAGIKPLNDWIEARMVLGTYLAQTGLYKDALEQFTCILDKQSDAQEAIAASSYCRDKLRQ